MADLDFQRALAWAVVQRAVLDLTIVHERDSDLIRRDAYAFLTKRLWVDDCLWRDLLCEVLIERKLVEAINLRVTRGSDGRIETK